MTTSRLRACLGLAAIALALSLTWVLRQRPTPALVAETSRVVSAPVAAAMPAGAAIPAPVASDSGEAATATASKSPARLAALRRDALEKVQAFDDWLTAWRRADAATQPALAGAGLDLALARRAAFKHLIETAPRLALAHAIPVGLRADLPADVRGQIERRIDARGDIDVQVACGVEGARIDRAVVIGAERFAVASLIASEAGHRERQAQSILESAAVALERQDPVSALLFVDGVPQLPDQLQVRALLIRARAELALGSYSSAAALLAQAL